MSDDKAKRQEEMTKAPDNWLMKYCEQELGYKITDPKHIGYDNISASQEPGSELWVLEIKGNVAGGVQDHGREARRVRQHRGVAGARERPVGSRKIKGNVAGGGPKFTEKFTMKQDPSDKQWMVRKDEFSKA
eukprot:Sspe_Gene.973::Locus_330_Transcript_10_15_Confidence_0.168_Length_690::g.973::m.973